MAMMKQQWSISALAVEFSLTRRTVAKRIQNIAPSGKLNGKPTWRLMDVADALSRDGGHSAADAKPNLPPELAWLEAITDPVDAMTSFALIHVAEQVPAQIAVLAIAAGADCKTAFATAAASRLALINIVHETAEALDIKPLKNSDADVWRVDLPSEPDWKKLAKDAGEKVDIPAWKQHVRARFGEAQDAPERND